MQNQPTTHTIHTTRRQALKQFGAAFAAIALLPALPALADDGKLDEDVRLKHFNLGKNKLALSGYDPVSYHVGKPKKGSSKAGRPPQGRRLPLRERREQREVPQEPIQVRAGLRRLVRLGDA